MYVREFYVQRKKVTYVFRYFTQSENKIIFYKLRKMVSLINVLFLCARMMCADIIYAEGFLATISDLLTHICNL